MPIASPFHERTQPLCTSYRWKDWAGYYAVCSYDTTHDREYFAFRETAGMIDVTPLYKYEVRGPDAAALLGRMTVRDVAKLKVGRVGYCCWCDDEGKVIDDGTVSCLDPEHYRLTAADPTYDWLARLGRGHDVAVEDSSRRLAALAIQGPTSREVLRAAGVEGIDGLKFFGVSPARIDGLEVWVSRTGYTGDLGYEVWVEAAGALRLWDALAAAGRPHGLEPAGLDALDLTRIEAGFIMLGVDYFSSHRVVLESRKSSPFEIGLGWTVKLDREPFVGAPALAAERQGGSPWQLVGLEASWEELEALYEGYGLPASLPPRASREPLPVYAEGAYGGRGPQVGRVTSHCWSPLLKRYLGLASVRAAHAAPGTRLQLEHTVEWERHTVTATVVATPFFNPPRKREVPAAPAPEPPAPAAAGGE
jgi:glycine cleavage system T protein (aminomethyltransferase)